MQFKLGVLGEDDQILDVWGDRVAIKRKNKKIEIIDFIFDEDGTLRIQPISIIICLECKDGTVQLDNEHYILEDGDEIFKASYEKIYIRKNNKDIEIFTIEKEENGCYLAENSILITSGNKLVSVKIEGTNIEIGTF
jgi:hypothetical protein